MRFLVALAFALASTLSSAADFYWVILGNSSVQYGSASSACSGYIKSKGNTDYSFSSVSIGSDGVGQCYASYQGSGSYSYGQVARGGDSCPSGSSYNSQSGSCDASNKCEAVKGASTTYTVKSSSSSSPPTSVVVNGCEASFSGVMACGNNTKGFYVCTGKLTFSGSEGTSVPDITAFDCSNVDCSKERIQPTSSNTPCSYTTSGNISKCTSTTSTSTPGTTTGTPGSDGKYSFNEDPLAVSTQTTINTTIVTNTTSGGGSSSTKTDDASVTKCVGVSGSCTTKNGTTTSTSTTGADGKVSDGGSTCTGETCEVDSGVPGTFTGVEPCADCSWEKSGEYARSQLKKFGPTDDAGNSIGTGTFVSQSFDRFKKTPLISAVSSISFPDGGGQCPNLNTEVFGTTIGFDSICTLMTSVSSILAPVMYAFWSLVAVFVLLSA